MARDPYIEGVEWHFNFDDRNYYLANPYTLIWFTEEGDQPKDYLRDAKGEVYQDHSYGAFALPTREAVSIRDVTQSLDAGREPNPSDELISQRPQVD